MELADLYLDLLKKKLTDFSSHPYSFFKPINRDMPDEVKLLLTKYQFEKYFLCEMGHFNPIKRARGQDLPLRAETMIGLLRLQNIENCFREILNNGIKGDLFEAGVWKGGATIFMNALNKVLDNSSRNVWVADSFEGLPVSRLPEDLKYNLSDDKRLAISLEDVKVNFKKYNLLDEKVQFVKGWFCDTLPVVAVDKIALLRLDGDLYESTMDILQNLYTKVQSGGYIIVDDYSLECCRLAVQDFRAQNNIHDEIHVIDWTGVYWKKS